MRNIYIRIISIYCISEDIKTKVDPLKSILSLAVAAKAWAERKHSDILLNDEGVSIMEAVVGIAITLIILVAIYSIAPVIGHNIDNSVSIPADSQWNSTTNTDLPTGEGIWTQNGALLLLVVTVAILSLVIYAVTKMQASGGGGAGQ